MFTWTPSKGGKAGGGKDAPVVSDLERRRQASAAAVAFIHEQSAKYRRPAEAHDFVLTNKYIPYGYIMTGITGIFATCMAIGERVPLIANYRSFIALIGGYGVGTQLHELHKAYCAHSLATALRGGIDAIEAQEELVGKEDPNSSGGKKGAVFVPREYAVEVERLTKLRNHVAPRTLEALAAAADEQKVAASLDERVSRLIDTFDKRKSAAATTPAAAVGAAGAK